MAGFHDSAQKAAAERVERRGWLLDDVSVKTNSLARSVGDAREGHCDSKQILGRINARLELEGFTVFPKPPKGSINNDPVAKLIIDVQSAAELLAKAVVAAQVGIKGISFEDWHLRKVITEELSKVGMQAVPL
jgi:hypothetical protein